MGEFPYRWEESRCEWTDHIYHLSTIQPWYIHRESPWGIAFTCFSCIFEFPIVRHQHNDITSLRVRLTLLCHVNVISFSTQLQTQLTVTVCTAWYLPMGQSTRYYYQQALTNHDLWLLIELSFWLLLWTTTTTRKHHTIHPWGMTIITIKPGFGW